MKKQIAVSLYIMCFLCLFCACAKQTSPPITDTTSEPTAPSNSTAPTTINTTTESTAPSTSTETPTEPQVTEVSPEHQVDFTPTGEVVANVVDAVSETFEFYGNIHSLRLPYIDLPGPNVEAINAEIVRKYTSDYYKYSYTNTYYHWTVKDDILSVVIVGGGSMHDGGWEGYGCDAFSVYNISVSKCRLLSHDEVYAAGDIADVKTRVLHAIVSYGAEWKGREESARTVFFGAPDYAHTITTIEEELSEESFARAVPYFNESGQLCVMGYVVTNIGAGGFYGFVPVYQYEAHALMTASEYYDYFYQLYSK